MLKCFLMICTTFFSIAIFPNTNISQSSITPSLDTRQMAPSDGLYFTPQLIDYYSESRISLSFYHNIKDVIETNYSLDAGQIDNIHIENDIGVISCLFEIFNTNASVSFYLSTNQGVFESSAYFSRSFDNKYFSSYASADAAEIKKLEYEYQSKYISTRQYEKARQTVFSIDTIINTANHELISTSDLIQFSVVPTYIASFSWVDKSGITRPLSFAKIELIHNLENPFVKTTNYTDENGEVAFRFLDSEKYNNKMRVYAGGTNVQVIDNNKNDYYIDIDFLDHNTYVTFSMTNDFGKALQISQAAIHNSIYAKHLTGYEMTPVTIIYPYENNQVAKEDQTCFYDDNIIHIFALTQNSLKSFEDWDLIGHEYGHHIQNQEQFFIAASPGGKHYDGDLLLNRVETFLKANLGASKDEIEANKAWIKDQTVRLTWSEGWATYFSIVSQKFFLEKLVGIPGFGDDSYHGDSLSQVQSAYNDIEGSTYFGEGHSMMNARLLFQIPQINTQMSMDKVIWNYTLDSYTASLFIEKIILDMNMDIDFMNSFGRILGALGFGSSQLRIIEEVQSIKPPVFEWHAGGSFYIGNNSFVLEFYNQMGNLIFKTEKINFDSDTDYLAIYDGPLNFFKRHRVTYELSQTDWMKILAEAGNDFVVRIVASQRFEILDDEAFLRDYFKDIYEETEFVFSESGDYYSRFYTFAKPEGYEKIKSTSRIQPADYGFEAQYFFDEKEKIVTAGGIMFNTKRLRTGFIENEKINLSPRRTGAGIAYLEYDFFSGMEVARIDIDLSYWTGNDGFLKDAKIEYKNQNGEWVEIVDLDADKFDLPTDRTEPKTYKIVFDAPVTAFRIYLTDSPTGSSNGGRLSISDLVIYYIETYNYSY